MPCGFDPHRSHQYAGIAGVTAPPDRSGEHWRAVWNSRRMSPSGDGSGLSIRRGGSDSHHARHERGVAQRKRAGLGDRGPAVQSRSLDADQSSRVFLVGWPVPRRGAIYPRRWLSASALRTRYASVRFTPGVPVPCPACWATVGSSKAKQRRSIRRQGAITGAQLDWTSIGVRILRLPVRARPVPPPRPSSPMAEAPASNPGKSRFDPEGGHQRRAGVKAAQRPFKA